MGVLIPVVLLLLLLGALADIITSDPSRIRHLPKMFWILIVILMPLVGSILWFAVGHDYSQSVDRGGFGDPRRREQPGAAPLDTRRPAGHEAAEFLAAQHRAAEHWAAQHRAGTRRAGAGDRGGSHPAARGGVAGQASRQGRRELSSRQLPPALTLK